MAEVNEVIIETEERLKEIERLCDAISGLGVAICDLRKSLKMLTNRVKQLEMRS